MADLHQSIDSLLSLDPLQRLEAFAGMDLQTKVAIVKELHEQDDLAQLKKVFDKLYPSQLVDLLHELDREICEEIFTEVGDEQRLAVMLNLHSRGITNDLNAAIRVVGADEILDLLRRIPNSARRDIFKLASSRDQVDVLIKLHSDECEEEFRSFIEEVDPADIADLLEELDRDDRERVLDVLHPQLQADALVELKARVALDFLRDLPVKRLVDLLQLMAVDDVVELIGLLERREQQAVLAVMEPEQREEVQELLTYEEDSAGLIMTRETCSMPQTASVAETRRALSRISDTTDPIFYVYVTDPEDDTLVGAVPVIRLVNAAPGKRLADICDLDVPYTSPEEDQEEIARRFRKYDIWVMPVVDDNRKLIGRITVDDVIDVVHEEADEDLAHLVGAPDIEDEDDSPFRISRKRLPWLLITMCAGLLNGFVIERMYRFTDGIVILTALAPAILAMGGNTGMQSSAVCIRGIALGQEKYSHLMGIVWREIRVGATLGIVCGTLSGTAVTGVITLALRTGVLQSASVNIGVLKLGLIVGTAMFCAMTFASSFGSITPIILHRLSIDPAIASGPFVTTSSDLSAALIYLCTCMVMLHLLV